MRKQIRIVTTILLTTMAGVFSIIAGTYINHITKGCYEKIIFLCVLFICIAVLACMYILIEGIEDEKYLRLKNRSHE